MDTMEAVRTRRSVREFKDQPIPAEFLDALIEAIRWAPSAGNLQSRKFYLVFDCATKKRLDAAVGNPSVAGGLKRAAKKLLGRRLLSGAPLVAVACCDLRIAERYGSRGTDLYCIQDAAASTMNLMLVAHGFGLGSVWVGGFDEGKVARVLGLPGHLRPVAMIPVGFPARVPAPVPRMAGAEAVVIVQERCGK